MWGEPVDGKFSNYGYGLILFDRGEIRIKGTNEGFCARLKGEIELLEFE